MMSLDQAEAELIQQCKEISELEKRLRVARTRAEKLAHYIEIAREYEASLRTDDPGEQETGGPKIIRLRKRRRRE